MKAPFFICLSLVAVALGLGHDTLGQQSDTTKNSVIGAFVIMPIEFPDIDSKGINDQLAGAGLPSASHSTANVGIGLQLYTNRFITRFSFNKNTRRSGSTGYRTEVEYRSTSFNVGYSLTKSKWLSVFPFVGFKGSALSYLHREQAPDPIPMEDYLQTQLRHLNVTNSRAHLDLGLGISYQWFYLIDFRFGYLLPLEKVRWKVDNAQTLLADTPAISYNFYFSLAIGLGNIVNDADLRRRFVEP